MASLDSTSALVTRLYEVFARYAYPGQWFCGFCYTPEEVEYFTSTPVAEIAAERGRTLLWECEGHQWHNPDIYRHYLPRLLELLGPPWNLNTIFPSHLSETLLALKFREWPAVEREAVLAYLTAMTPHITRAFDEEERAAWQAGLNELQADS
jgi:hypothetical protein